jgi:electron transport complex protein RnfC
VLRTFKLGGIHPPENKLSKGKTIEVLPIPEKVVIPLAQHIGAPATAIVAKGDTVKVGQLIAKSSGFISANIHSSVSGIVAKIDSFVDGNGYPKQAIFINVEGDEWIEDIDRTDKLETSLEYTKEEIIKKVADAGIVGLGGATFPANVKLMPPPGTEAEVLIVNAVECEPYLTSDDSIMLERGEEIISGVAIVMKALDVKRAIIGVENNKPKAIKNLRKLAKRVQGIKIQALNVRYPQGGEKQLIKACIDKEVPSGALPIAVGAVIQNVGTILAIYEAVYKNKALFERVVTITGKSISKPGNYLCRIGTPIKNLIEIAGGLPDDTGKVVGGGPMMGKALSNVEAPLTKGSSGILIMPAKESSRGEERDCIRCTKCVNVCPMGLEPFLLMALAERNMIERLEKELIMDCIECGSCSFTCPANRSLLDYIRLGKGRTGNMIRNRKQ